MSLVERCSLFCYVTEVSWLPTKLYCSCSERPQNLIVQRAQSFSSTRKSLAVLSFSIGQGRGSTQGGRLHACLTRAPANQHHLAPTPWAVALQAEQPGHGILQSSLQAQNPTDTAFQAGRRDERKYSIACNKLLIHFSSPWDSDIWRTWLGSSLVIVWLK